jgi:PQ loop repeat
MTECRDVPNVMVSKHCSRRQAGRTDGVTPVIITILAWTGAVLSCLLTIPQAVRTLRSDRMDGLSATT